MRSNLILLTLLTCIPLSWMHPFVGVLTWCWLSFMNPHQLVWGLATELRLNLIISLVTILGYIFSKEPKSIPNNACVYLLFALAILWIISAKMALAPQISDPLLTRHLKTFVLLIMVLALVNSRLRLHALVTVIVISIGYYGVYGGLVGVLSGGASRFAGPPSSQIADNNHLALAIIVIIPLANWLRMHSSNKLVKLALLASMGCGVLGVLVTYSRGGLLGLAAMGSILWWKSKHKLLSLIIMAAIALPAISLLPQEWWWPAPRKQVHVE
jgi:putative inorganic carbon (HCO3(-)) transporter